MLNELKIYLNIENNEKDFLLENWILEAKEFIKSIIWEFEKKTFEKNLISENKMIFLHWVNINISKIEKNIWNFFNPEYQEINKCRFENNCVFLQDKWEYKVYYSVGFQNIPLDIKTAIFLYTKEKNSFENWKISKESVDMDMIEFELDKNVDNTINSLISKYKLYDFSA